VLETAVVGFVGPLRLMGKGVVACMVARPGQARHLEIKMRSDTGVLPVRKRPNVGAFRS